MGAFCVHCPGDGGHKMSCSAAKGGYVDQNEPCLERDLRKLTPKHHGRLTLPVTVRSAPTTLPPEDAACRCGWTGDGPHPCHADGYQCRKPAERRDHDLLATTSTWACDACWAEILPKLDRIAGKDR